MPPALEDLAVAFANTRSSIQHDRIATPAMFTRWAGAWPTLAPLAQDVSAGVLARIHEQRDATQQVLRSLAPREQLARQALDLATSSGMGAAPFKLVVVGADVGVDGELEAAIRHLLSRAVVDLLLSPNAGRLRRCAGAGCWKVFVLARADRRWCDSKICGNRARVAAHARRAIERRGPRR